MKDVVTFTGSWMSLSSLTIIREKYKQREDIKKSLENFGFVQPLVIYTNEDRKNIVIGGNQRRKRNVLGC